MSTKQSAAPSGHKLGPEKVFGAVQITQKQITSMSIALECYFHEQYYRWGRLRGTRSEKSEFLSWVG